MILEERYLIKPHLNLIGVQSFKLERVTGILIGKMMSHIIQQLCLWCMKTSKHKTESNALKQRRNL